MEDGFEMRGAFTEKILQKIFKHFIKKKLGVDVDISLHDISLNFINDNACITVYADAVMDKVDFKQLVLDAVTKGE